MNQNAHPIKTEDELQNEGWTQASLTGGQHLERTVEMYKELGFEVYLAEVDTKDCGQCAVCYESGNETMYRIYTRPGKGDDC